MMKSSQENIKGTESVEQHYRHLEWNQTEVEIEVEQSVSDYDSRSFSEIEEVTTREGETDISEVYFREKDKEKEKDKNRRARASALMDGRCLHYLDVFKKNKALYVEELNERLEHTKDWLKISMLIRADFLETLDSTIRITTEGIEAWDLLNQLRNMPDIVNELDE